MSCHESVKRVSVFSQSCKPQWTPESCRPCPVSAPPLWVLVCVSIKTPGPSVVVPTPQRCAGARGSADRPRPLCRKTEASGREEESAAQTVSEEQRLRDKVQAAPGPCQEEEGANAKGSGHTASSRPRCGGAGVPQVGPGLTQGVSQGPLGPGILRGGARGLKPKGWARPPACQGGSLTVTWGMGVAGVSLEGDASAGVLAEVAVARGGRTALFSSASSSLWVLDRTFETFNP